MAYLIDLYLSSTHEEATAAPFILEESSPAYSGWPYSRFSNQPLTTSLVHLLLVRSHQAEIIVVKRLIQEHNNVTRVEGEPRSCNQSGRKNDAFTLPVTLPTNPGDKK